MDEVYGLSLSRWWCAHAQGEGRVPFLPVSDPERVDVCTGE